MSTRKTASNFVRDELENFFAGIWVTCDSTWLVAARWDEAAGILHAQFKGGWVEPISCDRARAESFAAAPSKGGWWWDNVMGK